jgi:hypothetical protein
MEPFISCWLLKPTGWRILSKMPSYLSAFHIIFGFWLFHASRIEVVQFSGQKPRSSTSLPSLSTFYLLASAPALCKFSCGGSDSENTYFRWLRCCFSWISWLQIILVGFNNTAPQNLTNLSTVGLRHWWSLQIFDSSMSWCKHSGFVHSWCSR